MVKQDLLLEITQNLYCMHREAVPRAVFVVKDAIPVLQVLKEGAHKGRAVRIVECSVASPETL
jgi:hypothetical protein